MNQGLHFRKQYLDITRKFGLVQEHNREELFQQFMAQRQAFLEQKKPVPPILSYCISMAPNKEIAIIQHILNNHMLVYWPLHLTKKPAIPLTEPVLQLCRSHCLLPVKQGDHLLVIAGTNPYDAEGINACYQCLGQKHQMVVFVFAHPRDLLRLLT